MNELFPGTTGECTVQVPRCIIDEFDKYSSNVEFLVLVRWTLKVLEYQVTVVLPFSFLLLEYTAYCTSTIVLVLA